MGGYSLRLRAGMCVCVCINGHINNARAISRVIDGAPFRNGASSLSARCTHAHVRGC